MNVVRIGLPALIAIVGLALIVGGSDQAQIGAGVALVGVALLVALVNALVRLSITSQRDREREESARRYFDRHGRWPERGSSR